MRRGIKLLTVAISAFAIAAGVLFGPDAIADRTANAQGLPPQATPTPDAAKPFDQTVAIAKIAESFFAADCRG